MQGLSNETQDPDDQELSNNGCYLKMNLNFDD